jgi:hypothetical protein
MSGLRKLLIINKIFFQILVQIHILCAINMQARKHKWASKKTDLTEYLFYS